MYKCYSDRYGNMPCDNGCICDKCMFEDVEIISLECADAFEPEDDDVEDLVFVDIESAY